MADATGDNPSRVTMHCLSIVLLHVELLGAAEVAPRAIGGTSGDSVSHDEPPIQAQGDIDQHLS